MDTDSQKFTVVSDEVVDSWTILKLPKLSTLEYDTTAVYQDISLGLFAYDTSFIKKYARDTYNSYFASGRYDGWSYGSVMYF